MDPQIPTQNTQPEPLNIPQPVQSEKPKANSKIIILFSILVILLLAALAFLYYQNVNLQKQIAFLQSSPTPSATPDPTANWKTYTNTQYGFSLKYPSQLTESADEGAPGVSGPITGLSISNSITNIFNPSILGNRNDATFDGFSIYEIDTSLITNFTYASYLNSELTAIKNSPRGVQTATIQQISLDNQSFSYIDSEIDIRRYFILSPDGKKLIIFSRTNSTSAFPSTFDQILSTFEFAGQTSGTTISNEYSIQIPSSWNGKYQKTSNQICDTYTFIGKTMNYELFRICKMSFADWTALSNLPDQPTKLASSGDYVYVEHGPLEVGTLVGEDLTAYQSLMQNYQSIIKTFKLN